MPKLIVYAGDRVAREVPQVRDPFVIGRALESDLAVMDHLVSRKHAKLERDPGSGGAWRVVDLGSSNGIYVNDERVQSRHLRHGDRIRIGSATIEFQDEIPAGGSSPMSIAFGDEPQGMSVMKSVAELKAEYTLSAQLREGKKGEDQREAKNFAVLFTMLSELAKEINSARSLDDLFGNTLKELVKELDGGVGAIVLIDRSTGELVPRALCDRRGRGAGGGNELRLSRTIVNKVVEDKAACLIRDAMLDGRFAAGKSVAAMQIRSAICVPIWDAGEVDGVLYIDNSNKPGAFDDGDMRLVTAIGNQLAVAIKREELVEKMKREAIVRSNLERYHSPDEVEMILRHEGEVGLDVREADVTVLYADIEGFTKLCERLPPAEVARLLNAIFEVGTAAIFRNKGQVNKYIGDAIMAVFGAPIPNPEHAANACRAALEMQQALREFRATLPESERFRVRIGINSGPVVAGNIGTRQRLEYTVIGSTVNVAARLEPIAPADGIAIGSSTAERIRARGFAISSLGTMKLKNVQGEVPVFQLLGSSTHGEAEQPFDTSPAFGTG